MGIVQWRTWLIGGPPSPRPGTMHLQTSNSAIRIVEGPLSRKRRPTTWQCESHSVSGKPSNCWEQGGWRPAGLMQTATQLAPSLDALCDRRQILQTWTTVVQLPIPRLEDQGSDALLKKQFKLCAQAEVGWIASKYIISAYFSVTRPR